MQSQLRGEILNTSAILRKKNFKIQNKGMIGLLRKFGISKEEEGEHDQQLRQKREISFEESMAKKKGGNLSRISTGPAHLIKEFSEIT